MTWRWCCPDETRETRHRRASSAPSRWLDPDRGRRLVAELPEGQTLVSTASPLPDGIAPALVIDVSAMVTADG